MTVTIELMGGLGNQLFQIFTLIAYSLDTKNSFYIEDQGIVHGHRKKNYWDNILKNIGKFRKPVKEINGAIREKGFNYEQLPPVPDKNINIKLLGYFQSYKYFHHQIDNIYKFTKIPEIRNQYNDNYDYQYTISLHFRVGDYKAIQEHHPLLKVEYYIDALSHIIQQTGRSNWQILFFCEDQDLEYVHEKIEIIQKSFTELSFIKIDSAFDDWEQMLIMSHCRHNIIANSSFSWFGAYFRSSEGIVCYPKTWFGPAQGKKDMKDMFLDSWILIDQ